MFEKETNLIKRMSQTGLWGSVATVFVTMLFVFVSPWRFPNQTEYVNRWMLIAGSVLAILSMSMGLLVVRKQIPRLRQAENLQGKVQGYAAHVRSLFLSVFAVVVILCLLMVLSNQSVLLMLAFVTVLFLFLAYPNIYKVKVDLGLTNDEMKQLYGDKYIEVNNEA